MTDEETRDALIEVVRSTGEALAAAVTAAGEAGVGPAVLIPILAGVFNEAGLLPPGAAAFAGV